MAIRPMKKTCSSGHQDGEACGESLTEIPYSRKDGTKLVRTGKPEDYTLEWLESSTKSDTGYVSICKKCDCYPEWPRAK